MRRGIALLGFVVAVATAAVAAMFVGHGPSSAQRFESLGGAADQPGPARRQHRPVRVRQSGRHEQGHDRRQLHPARSSGQRAELPELRRHRALRDQDRQHGRRQGRHRLPVPVHDRRRGTRTRSSTTSGRSASLSDPNWNRPQTYSVTLVHFKKDGKIEKGGKNGPSCCADTTCRRRPTTSGRARRRTTTRSRRRRSRTLPAAARSSPASVTTRSSSTSARSSIWPGCGRSTRST